MLKASELPKEIGDLAHISIALPHVPLTRLADPDSYQQYLFEYLVLEDFRPDDGEIEFIRTAKVRHSTYYIWRFTCDGEECFATVNLDKRTERMSCRGNPWGFTPEQYIVADFHKRI